MHTTADKYQVEQNNYKTFLSDREELPRLSILDNYKQIMRIMTNSYIKSADAERKFKNVDPKSAAKDPEFAKYKEEEQNTMKMSTILKSLNSPKKKRKTIAAMQDRRESNANTNRSVGRSSIAGSQRGSAFALRP